MGSDPGFGLGIDAGGTTTRWAVARGDQIVATGEAPAMSALMMKTSDGRSKIREAVGAIAKAALAVGQPKRIEAGITGLGDRDGGELRTLIARPFHLDETAVTLRNDIYFAYLGLFAPGEGYIVYAGTGSVGAHVDAQGVLHRAGGRGHILDDGGGGFWIARKAMRRIWRDEDARPGTWKDSAMAREIFASLGGDDWAHTREAVYGGDRGDFGRLALVVAATADRDPAARTILEAAGRELARLANAMVERLGPKPVRLTGRAAQLHPAIESAMRAALLPGIALEAAASEAHCAAARLAAHG